MSPSIGYQRTKLSDLCGFRQRDRDDNYSSLQCDQDPIIVDYKAWSCNWQFEDFATWVCSRNSVTWPYCKLVSTGRSTQPSISWRVSNSLRLGFKFNYWELVCRYGERYGIHFQTSCCWDPFSSCHNLDTYFNNNFQWKHNWPFIHTTRKRVNDRCWRQCNITLQAAS